MAFLGISLSSCGSGGVGNTAVTGAEKMEIDQAISGEVVIQLEWERSIEDSDSILSGTTLGSAVEAGLALLIEPDEVAFDNGIYTAEANIIANPIENEWASWPQWHGGCRGTYEVRHLQASFTLPTGLDIVRDLILFSPYYTDHGDIIPINDNIYIFLNGTFIGEKGTSYGASRAPRADGAFDFANETDGWYTDGSFGSDAAELLQSGLNVLDIVAEEWCGWGGIGRLDLKLLAGPIEVPVI